MIMLFNLIYISAVKHYVRYFLTASSGTQGLPEFIGFGTFDGDQSGYCDSSGRLEPQQEWARRFFQDNPEHVQMYTEDCERLKHFLSGYTKDLNQQMNQTEGDAPSCLQEF